MGKFCFKNLILIVLAIVILSGCANIAKDEYTAEELEWLNKWQENYDLWSSSGIEDYTYHYYIKMSLWYRVELEVTVEDSEVASYKFVDFWGNFIQKDVVDVFLKTIDGLFMDLKELEPKFTEVTYNEDYGYPQKVMYDDLNIIDEENLRKITEFKITE